MYVLSTCVLCIVCTVDVSLVSCFVYIFILFFVPSLSSYFDVISRERAAHRKCLCPRVKSLLLMSYYLKAWSSFFCSFSSLFNELCIEQRVLCMTCMETKTFGLHRCHRHQKYVKERRFFFHSWLFLTFNIVIGFHFSLQIFSHSADINLFLFISDRYLEFLCWNKVSCSHNHCSKTYSQHIWHGI